MNKVVVSFLGRDCPGVVHAVSSLLNDLSCNIDEVSQTILHGEFAAIVIASMPEGQNVEALRYKLQAGLVERNVDLNVATRLYDGTRWEGGETVPYVITIDGPDSPGLIAGITGVFTRYNVNIENLKAINPDNDPERALIVYELAMPDDIDRSTFRSELLAEAERLGVRASMQHRDIFEAVHRVQPV